MCLHISACQPASGASPRPLTFKDTTCVLATGTPPAAAGPHRHRPTGDKYLVLHGALPLPAARLLSPVLLPAAECCRALPAGVSAGLLLLLIGQGCCACGMLRLALSGSC
jgi:hypothetical protein